MINKFLFRILRYSGLPFLFRELIQRDKVTILMFHDIAPKAADRAFAYLSVRYNIIGLDTFLDAAKAQNPKALPRKALVITFDDGHKRNYDLSPVFKKYGIPVTIFLCSGIVNTNRHYWFNFKHPDIDSSELKKVSNADKLKILRRVGFDVEREFETRQALTRAEIAEMRALVNFQAHTVFHPCLPTCNDQEARNEIAEAKKILESDFALRINALAYPNGDYTEREVRLSKDAGYDCAVTVDYGFNTVYTDPFRLKRLSVNDTENPDELVVKASGVWGAFTYPRNLFRRIPRAKREA